MESPGGKSTGASPEPSLMTIAAELGRRHAEMAAAGGPIEAQDAVFDRLYSQIRDLEEAIARRTPASTVEALVTASVAIGLLIDLDEPGNYVHAQACALGARLVDYLEAAAGVSAGELGLGRYADIRNRGPSFTTVDADQRFLRALEAVDHLRARGRGLTEN